MIECTPDFGPSTPYRDGNGRVASATLSGDLLNTTVDKSNYERTVRSRPRSDL